MKKLIVGLSILCFVHLLNIACFAATGDPVLEGKTATGNIISTGVFQAGTAATVPGAITLFDAGILTWWDDGDDFSVTAAVTDGTTKLRITGSVDVSAQVIAGSAAVPDSVGGATIGLATLEWADAYFEDGAIVYFGDDQDVTLTHVADTGLTVNLNIAAATYGSDGTISDADLLAIDDGATTTIAVGGGVGSPIAWTTATGTGAPVRASSPILITPALGTPSAAVLTSATGLPMTTGVTGVLPMANGGTDSSTNGAILGDVTAGRVIRRSYMSIGNGTNANTAVIEVGNNWNGDTIGSTNNCAKGATTGNFTLNAGGTRLTIEAAGLTGNVVAVLSAELVVNASGVALLAQGTAATNDIQLDFRLTTADTAQDLTVLVDTGALTLYITYVTDS
jgi:hypothetical protein